MRTVKLTILLLMSLSCLSSYAQDQKKGMSTEQRERLEAMKVGFFTKKLELTADEAQKFWPVYNEHSEERQALNKKKRSELKAAREKFDTMSDGELEKLVDQQIIYAQQELDLRKKYHARFKEVLPIKKVAKLYRAEDEFKRMLLRHARQKNQQGQQGTPRGQKSGGMRHGPHSGG